MQLIHSYTITEKIKNLSGRLRYIARENNSSRDYVDQRIKSQNLLLNLSSTIAKLLLRIQFVTHGKNELIAIIDTYNIENSTSLSVQTFEELTWIRYIQDEIQLPSVVSHFLWKVGYDESEGKEAKIPDGLEHETRCLQRFYKQYIESAKLIISRSNIEEVVAENSRPEVDIDFFVAAEILRSEGSDTFSWDGGNYAMRLNNEICATLWLLLTANSSDDDLSFRRLFKIMSEAQFWPDRLTTFLDAKHINRLCDSVIKFILDEIDLLQSDDEIKKIWLDSPRYTHQNIETTIPSFKFDYTNTVSFIRSVEYSTFHYPNAFDYQEVRSSYNLAIGILLEGDGLFQNPYSRVLKLLRDTSRPYIVWEIYTEIRRRYPEIIPHLLTIPELSVIPFKLIDDIDLHPTSLHYSEHRDGTFEESCEVKSQLWLELFDLSVEQLPIHALEPGTGEYLLQILLDIADKVFINSSNVHGYTQHHQYKARYDEVLKRLRSWRTSDKHGMVLELKPRRIFLFLPQLLSSLQKEFDRRPLSRTGYIQLQSGLFDLSIEAIRLSNIRASTKEVHALLRTKIEEGVYGLLMELSKEIQTFYSIKNVRVLNYDLNASETNSVKRRVNDFGFEIIDWGYLYLHFHRHALDKYIYKSFLESLDLKTDGDQYDDQNREEQDKIQLYLLSVMLAFLSIVKHRDNYEIEGLPVLEVKELLQDQITTIAIKYSINNLPEGRIDVFDDRITFKNSLYHKRLTNLLFQCVNFFNKEIQEKFIERFFQGSLDIGRMLEGVNVLESKKLTAIISKKISTISIEEFIESSTFTTELKSALIDAANSEEHWELAKPLLTKLKRHFERIKIPYDNTVDLLYEVDLLIAFKEKDFERLNSIPVPEKDSYYREHNLRLRHLKEFFIALHMLHNEKKHNEAIETFKMLHSHSPASVRFAFKLFEAETELALRLNDLALLKQTNVDWQAFEQSAPKEKEETIVGYREMVAANKLHYYASIKDTVMFDHTINLLTNRYLYDETVLPTVYKYYTAQGLHELAHSYILKAQEYYANNEQDIPDTIQKLLDEAPTEHLLFQYKMSLGNIRNLRYDTIPKIVPDILNGEKELDKFILMELVHATRVVLDKIHSVKQITHENRYNDLLLACLRLRLPFYGWVILDQSRKGKSQTDKDAGEVDLVIEAGGQTIALLEALIIKNNEITKTQEHIQKCFGYIDYLSRYYIVTYYKGDPSKLDTIWEKYKVNVLKTKLPAHAQIDTAIGFQDISDNFKDARHLKVGVTMHEGDTKMFHLMVKLA